MPFPVDVKFVNEAERKLGVKFPAAFVVRMVRSNGGQISIKRDTWQLYPFFDTSDRTRLKRTCNDIVQETRKARERLGFPQEAVAIGMNGGGDVLVLLPSSDAPYVLGPLCWWDHETAEVVFVCDDFGDLNEVDE